MFFRQNLKSESGVTLIELLVVVALIGILAAGLIMVVDPKGQINKANDARRKSDLAQVQRALETYYQDFGRYPQSTVGTYNIQGAAWGAAWSVGGVVYMSKLPIDSGGTRKYAYNSPCPNNQCYYLYASLQRSQDPQVCNGGAVCTNAVGMLNACGAGNICNYGLSSPNVTP